jgi:hypothetical protein
MAINTRPDRWIFNRLAHTITLNSPTGFTVHNFNIAFYHAEVVKGCKHGFYVEFLLRALGVLLP